MRKPLLYALHAAVQLECWSYGIGFQRVPESLRGHLPNPIDLPSMTSNIAGSIAIASTAFAIDRMIIWSRGSTGAHELQKPLFGPLGMIVVVGLNAAAELNDIVDEQLAVAKGGEMRDFVAGVAAGGLVTALGVLHMRRQARANSEPTLTENLPV